MDSKIFDHSSVSSSWSSYNYLHKFKIYIIVTGTEWLNNSLIEQIINSKWKKVFTISWFKLSALKILFCYVTRWFFKRASQFFQIFFLACKKCRASQLRVGLSLFCNSFFFWGETLQNEILLCRWSAHSREEFECWQLLFHLVPAPCCLFSPGEHW